MFEWLNVRKVFIGLKNVFNNRNRKIILAKPQLPDVLLPQIPEHFSELNWFFWIYLCQNYIVTLKKTFLRHFSAQFGDYRSWLLPLVSTLLGLQRAPAGRDTHISDILPKLNGEASSGVATWGQSRPADGFHRRAWGAPVLSNRNLVCHSAQRHFFPLPADVFVQDYLWLRLFKLIREEPDRNKHVSQSSMHTHIHILEYFQLPIPETQVNKSNWRFLWAKKLKYFKGRGESWC